MSSQLGGGPAHVDGPHRRARSRASSRSPWARPRAARSSSASAPPAPRWWRWRPTGCRRARSGGDAADPRARDPRRALPRQGRRPLRSARRPPRRRRRRPHVPRRCTMTGYPPGVRSAYLAMERALARITHTVIHVSASQAEAARPARTRAGGARPRHRQRHRRARACGRRLLARERRPRRRSALDPAALVLGTVARFDSGEGARDPARGHGAPAAAPTRRDASWWATGRRRPAARARAAAGLGGTVVWAGRAARRGALLRRARRST